MNTSTFCHSSNQYPPRSRTILKSALPLKIRRKSNLPNLLYEGKLLFPFWKIWPCPSLGKRGVLFLVSFLVLLLSPLAQRDTGEISKTEVKGF